jgi:glycosyltransferase involved in cell wall biosynthesis
VEMPKERVPHRFVWLSSADRGLAFFITLFPFIRRHLPDAELHVFRDVSKADLPESDPDYITLHGHMANTQIQAELAAADYWVYTTNFTETFCISAVEAQRAGLVSIASDLAALSETVGGRGVLLKSPPDSQKMAHEVLGAILDLESDPERKQAMRRRGKKWARKQTWGRKVEEWLALFGHDGGGIGGSVDGGGGWTGVAADGRPAEADAEDGLRNAEL